jgi:hypothetical protein
MIPMSFSYTSPDVLGPALDGKYLAITFLGSDGIPRMVYDDFRLEAMPVPVPGVTGCLMMMTGCAAGSRITRRRR